MTSARKRHFLAVCLVLASVLYRGIIPTGFMPATGEAVRHGTLLVVCPHGEMGMRGHDGNGSHGASLEQCPFGAAAGPAVPSVKLVYPFTAVLAYFRPDRAALLRHGSLPRLHPPARAPPILS
jgi:hypothetical protein